MNIHLGAILAAGRGSRMGELAEFFPKPVLPIANEPLIVHHLRILRSLGLKDVYIVVSKETSKIIDILGSGYNYDLNIKYVEQVLPLGSAHALGTLEPFINGPFVVLLGDYYFFAPNIERLLDRAMSSGSSAMAFKKELSRRALCEACTLELTTLGRITRIVEKPKNPASNLKGCGIYVFYPEIFDAVHSTPRTAPKNEYELSISIQIYIQQGHAMYAEDVIEWDMNFTHPGDVLDCNLNWLAEKGLQNLIGKNIQLAPGTQIEHTILGDDIIVERPASMKEVVVFQGVRIRGGETIERALVTPNRTIFCKDY